MLRRLKQFRFDWKLTVLVLLFLPVTLRLGWWQLDREQEKRGIMAQYEARQQAQATSLEELDINADLQFSRVYFSGLSDNAQYFLLDNRIYQGVSGYEVIQPLRTVAGYMVFLNRGWIAQGQYRDQLPAIAPLPVQQEYQATVYVPLGKPVVLSDSLMSAGWPKVIQVADVAEMARVAGITDRLFPYTVRIEAGVEGALTRFWPAINLKPEMHRGYAVQWFAMSLMLLLIFGYYSTRPQSELTDNQEYLRNQRG